MQGIGRFSFTPMIYTMGNPALIFLSFSHSDLRGRVVSCSRCYCSYENQHELDVHDCAVRRTRSLASPFRCTCFQCSTTVYSLICDNASRSDPCAPVVKTRPPQVIHLNHAFSSLLALTPCTLARLRSHLRSSILPHFSSTG